MPSEGRGPNDIGGFFEPRSVAVAGVSEDPEKVASIIYRKLVRNAQSGELKASVYALNPRYRSVFGHRCYPDIRSLPEVPELVVAAIPVESVRGLVGEAAKAGTKAIVIVTAGFGEAGRKGLESEILELARRGGVRILGPNTIGLLDTRTGMDTLFLPETKKLPSGEELPSLLPPIKGDVVIVSQSGHLGEIIGEELRANGVGVRAIVGVGNQLDVSVEDLLAFFADDDETKVMTVYLEGLKDGRRFLRMASEAAKKKPVVVLKLGRTRAGARAAVTHTASMVGDYGIYREAFREAGLIEARSLPELVDMCTAFSLSPPASGDRVLIITNAGGTGAIAADESEILGLKVNPPSPRLLARLKRRFRDSSFMNIVSLSNPLDLTATATTNEFVAVSKMLIGSGEYDLLLVVPTHQPPTIEYSIAERMERELKAAGKPVCVCTMGTSELANRLHAQFLGHGVPSYRSPERAVKALWALSEYAKAKRLPPWSVPPTRTGSAARAVSRRGPVERADLDRLMARYSVPLPKSMVMTSKKEAPKEESTVGYPAACKLLSVALQHKSEKGGVILGIRNRRELLGAFEKLRGLAKASGVPFEGMLVQEMVSGIEVIMGSVRDATFGPVVIFGLGGVLTELLQDFATAIAPVSKEKAREMILSVRTAPVLQGYRGGPKVDVERLAELLARFSKILTENPSIEELEVNPMIVRGDRIVAVDVRGRAGSSSGIPGERRAPG
ncbi:MAG TPA: acetate--CoA ligase family protein [Conexivisphaerales archaeon]|nr:acetate--CoA ligase family protein [Conexivisphaerales archaeon]